MHRILLLATLAFAPVLVAADVTATPQPPTRYADSLTAAVAGAQGEKLNGRSLGEGKPAWSAAAALLVSSSGVTPSSAAGGSAVFPVPRIAGRYVLHAEIEPADKGSISLALGRGNLGAGAFGSETEVGVGMARGGGYEISLAGEKLRVGSAKDYGGLRPGGNAVDLEVDTVSETLSVRVNGTSLLDTSPRGSLISLRISRAGFMFYGPVTPNAPSVRNFSLQLVPASATAHRPTVGLKPVSLADFYVAPDSATTLRWKAELTGSNDEDEYEVSDYTGKVVAKGRAKVSREGAVSASLKLPAGFHELRFIENGEAFGVVAVANPPVPPDPYFGMDAGLTSLDGSGSTLHKEDITSGLREGYVATMKRVGIASVRERMNIGTLNPTPDKWNWESDVRPFDSVRKLYSDRHLPVLDMLWGGGKHLGITRTMPYPQELPSLARAWQAVANRYHGNWIGTEIWNEPDLIPIPADQYVPLAKVVSHVYRQSKVSTPVVGGVFAKVPPLYLRTCVANGLADSCDALSFHHYDSAMEMRSFVQNFRAGLKEAGRETLPLWITESGLPWGPGKSRAPLDRGALTALNIASKAVEGRAVGVARYYPFYLVPWGGANNFGLTDMEGTPQRALGAYAYAISALSGKEYRGDLDAPGALLARVFGDEKALVATIYTGTPNPEATVKLHVPVLRAEGIDGRMLSIGPDGTVPVPDGLGYVWLGMGAAKLLKTRTDASDLYAIGRQPPSARSESSPIVLQNAFDLSKATYSAQRYLLSEVSARSLVLPIRAANLSNQPLEATLDLSLPGGIAATDANRTIIIPPQGTVTVTWTVDASKALDVAETRFIRVTGKSGKGPPISPLAIPMMMEGDMETHLSRHPTKERLPVEDAKRWKPNIGTGTMKMTAEGTTWRLDCDFTGGMTWVFPLFGLTEPLNPQRHSGLLLRARILKPARHIGLSLRNGMNPGFVVQDMIPSDAAWHVVYLPFSEFTPEAGTDQNATLHVEKVSTVMVGFVSNQADNAMEISDLIVVGGAR